MSHTTHAARDQFAYGRGGMSAKALTFVPTIVGNQLNDAIACRIESPAEESINAILAFENFLGAWFGGGVLNAA
ncbi:MAG: hypothetical protein AAGA84_09240 [Pseudomonadota bacterium]